MFRVAVCDDLPEERKAIRGILEGELRSYDLDTEIREYENGKTLISDCKENGSDIRLIFLDIYMPETDGVETARLLRDMGCKADVVFLTTTPDFAIEGYEVEAAGYLLKPPDSEKLRRLLERLFQRENGTVLTLRQGNSVFTVNSSDIIYIESNRNRLAIHTVRDTFFYYGRLNELARRLPAKPFLRCHQSFLVNMDRIFSANNEFCMENGDMVPIRVRERRALREHYFEYITEKSLCGG